MQLFKLSVVQRYFPAAVLQEQATRVPFGPPVKLHSTQDDRKLCLTTGLRAIRAVPLIGKGGASTGSGEARASGGSHARS